MQRIETAKIGNGYGLSLDIFVRVADSRRSLYNKSTISKLFDIQICWTLLLFGKTSSHFFVEIDTLVLSAFQPPYVDIRLHRTAQTLSLF